MLSSAAELAEAWPWLSSDSAAFPAPLPFELLPFRFLGKLNSDFALLVKLVLGISFVHVGGSTRRLQVSAPALPI